MNYIVTKDYKHIVRYKSIGVSKERIAPIFRVE
jgi:hypothetical protein